MRQGRGEGEYKVGGTEGARGGREGGRKRCCETAREREWRQGGKVEGGLIIVFFIQSEPYIGYRVKSGIVSMATIMSTHPAG